MDGDTKQKQDCGQTEMRFRWLSCRGLTVENLVVVMDQGTIENLTIGGAMMLDEEMDGGQTEMMGDLLTSLIEAVLDFTGVDEATAGQVSALIPIALSVLPILVGGMPF